MPWGAVLLAVLNIFGAAANHHQPPRAPACVEYVANSAPTVQDPEVKKPCEAKP